MKAKHLIDLGNLTTDELMEIISLANEIMKAPEKYSEACRPILGQYTDGFLGKTIDLLAVIALIAGTATTFSIATPLLSKVLADLFNINSSKFVSIIILLIVCFIYTCSVLNGLKGVNMLSKICMLFQNAQPFPLQQHQPDIRLCIRSLS